jgi:RNA polymerase sigma-70 factor (ECF subfamily)
MTPPQDQSLFDRHFESALKVQSNELKQFAIKFTGCYHTADDLMQETIIRAWSHRASFRGGSSLKSWLFAIMRNTFINEFYRKAKRKKRQTIEMDAPGDAHALQMAVEPGPAMVLKDVCRVIQRLPKVFRHPLTLYIEGYKYREIAKLLEEPIGTIKHRIHFARKLVAVSINK